MAKAATANGFCKAHSGIATKLDGLEHNDEEIWGAIEKLRDGLDSLRNRLPVWATLVISLLTFALGATMTYAAFAVRLAHASTQ